MMPIMRIPAESRNVHVSFNAFPPFREQTSITVYLNQVAEDNLFEGKDKECKVVLN
jgi:hypothetical protein